MKNIGLGALLIAVLYLSFCAIVQAGENALIFLAYVRSFNWQPLCWFIINNRWMAAIAMLWFVVCLMISRVSYHQGKIAGRIEEEGREK